MVVLSKNEISQIKELIDDGFDIDIIAMELEIPAKQLQKLIEKENVIKASNLMKDEKVVKNDKEDLIKNSSKENYNIITAYKDLIKKYKNDIIESPQNAQEKRNLLAFAYFKAGNLDEARKELTSLIEANSSYMAYRQLIHIEKEERNFEDAKLWAYEALDKYPDSIPIRKQLISIAKIEQDEKEIKEQLKCIEDIRKREVEKIQLIIKTNRKKLQGRIKGNER